MKVINADDEADDAAIEYLGVETGVQMWHKAPRSCNHTLQTGLKVTIEKNEADILNVAVVEQSIPALHVNRKECHFLPDTHKFEGFGPQD